eukprot:GFKZ01007890.1.p1 GENE.GFKZ01007890.1~~GFKZ01007890.1.p1  ORF type:complete len:334 (-),score=33.74 GFKZ01007890.1:290-1252(-)
MHTANSLLRHTLSLLLLILPLSQAATINLPRGVLVEGVAHAAGSNFFAADIANGPIYLVDTNTNLTTTVARPAPNRTSIGIAATSTLLFAAGGGPFPGTLLGTGPSQPVPSLNVYEITTGKVIASCLPSGALLVNDVIASESERFAYFTDSARGAIYTLALDSLPACRVSTIILPPPIFSGAPTTANGIVVFRRGLIVANTALGTLYFVDLQNENRLQRLLDEGRVTGADGLDLVKVRGGALLYVTQNALNKVSVWSVTMTRRVVSLSFVRDIESDDFRFPTTVAVGAGRLVVPNARFDELAPTGFDIDDMVFTLSVVDL